MIYAHKTSLHCHYMDFAKFNNNEILGGNDDIRT
jgi:hypothetical protein